jgi:hypothetical protein
MADDFKTSFVDLIKERTSTPLWANFIFVWCVFNWHVLVLIFYSNSGNAIGLIELIKQHNFAPFWLVFSCSVLVTVLVPFINIGIFYLINLTKLQKENIRVKFSGLRIYTPEEYNKVNALYQIEKEKFEVLNKKFIDVDKTASDDKSAKIRAEENLSNVQKLSDSFDVPIQDLQDAYWNTPSTGFQISFELGNPIACQALDKTYYFSYRKVNEDTFIMYMINFVIARNGGQANKDDIIIIKTRKNFEGKNFHSEIIFRS